MEVGFESPPECEVIFDELEVFGEGGHGVVYFLYGT